MFCFQNFGLKALFLRPTASTILAVRIWYYPMVFILNSSLLDAFFSKKFSLCAIFLYCDLIHQRICQRATPKGSSPKSWGALIKRPKLLWCSGGAFCSHSFWTGYIPCHWNLFLSFFWDFQFKNDFYWNFRIGSPEKSNNENAEVVATNGKTTNCRRAAKIVRCPRVDVQEVVRSLEKRCQYKSREPKSIGLSPISLKSTNKERPPSLKVRWNVVVYVRNMFLLKSCRNFLPKTF